MDFEKKWVWYRIDINCFFRIDLELNWFFLEFKYRIMRYKKSLLMFIDRYDVR